MHINFDDALQSVISLCRSEKRKVSLENRSKLEISTEKAAQKALSKGLTYEDALAFQLSHREITS